MKSQNFQGGSYMDFLQINEITSMISSDEKSSVLKANKNKYFSNVFNPSLEP